MESATPLRHPWLVAAWPGMGGVAVLAAAHLVRSLTMEEAFEIPGRDFFEIQNIEVSKGLALPPRFPRGVFYEWRNPNADRDLLVFVGEAQPSRNTISLCKTIIDYAKSRGVERIVTFASMATQLAPSDPSRVHGVATNADLLGELRRLEVAPLKEGQIGGLNGVLLAVSHNEGLPAECVMAEIPYFAAGAPNPKAAKAALETFCALADLHIDLTELEEQGRQVDEQLEELLERMKEATRQEHEPSEFEESAFMDPDAESEPEEEKLDYASRQRIERLFDEAKRDRSKALHLKEVLDRLGVFGQYEDRFLDLFRRAE